MVRQCCITTPGHNNIVAYQQHLMVYDCLQVSHCAWKKFKAKRTSSSKSAFHQRVWSRTYDCTRPRLCFSHWVCMWFVHVMLFSNHSLMHTPDSIYCIPRVASSCRALTPAYVVQIWNGNTTSHSRTTERTLVVAILRSFAQYKRKSSLLSRAQARLSVHAGANACGRPAFRAGCTTDMCRALLLLPPLLVKEIKALTTINWGRRLGRHDWSWSSRCTRMLMHVAGVGRILRTWYSTQDLPERICNIGSLGSIVWETYRKESMQKWRSNSWK